jgi:hypothetical protein
MKDELGEGRNEEMRVATPKSFLRRLHIDIGLQRALPQ